MDIKREIIDGITLLRNGYLGLEGLPIQHRLSTGFTRN